MKACAKKADLVLVIGTSLSGLASDCVPEVRQRFYLLVLPVVVASSKKSNAHIYYRLDEVKIVGYGQTRRF